VHPTAARQGKPGGAIAERAAHRSMATRALRCTKRNGKMAKWRGDHRGAHLGQQMTQQTVVVARGGGAAPPDSGDGGGSMWGPSQQQDDGKLHKDVLVLLPASIVASGGGRLHAMMTARVWWVLSFASKNLHHRGCYL
jgi:hypothetical protein